MHRSPDAGQAAIYRQLHAIARRYMSRERQDHTLQPTALINEAYLRLAKEDPGMWDGRRPYFFREASRAMRQILVDHARRRAADKRGGLRTHVSLHSDMGVGTVDAPLDLLRLDEALTKLAALSHRQAETVELRFWAGLPVNEAAAALGVSERTVKGDTQIALAWLRRELREP